MSAAPPVSEAAAERWRAYAELERAGRPRFEVRAALEAFIAALDDRERDHERFTAWFLRRRYDRRRPAGTGEALVGLLSREVLTPVLLAGARAGSPDHLRWLHFATSDWRLRLLDHAPALYERSRRTGLLAAALVHNPASTDLWRSAFWREFDIAYWAGHHMDEGSMVQTDEDPRTALVHAREILAAAPTGALTANDVDELEDLEHVYESFFTWYDNRTDPDDRAYDGPIPKWVPPPPLRPRP